MLANDVDDRILVDDLASTSVIESLPLGTLAPGASLRKTFHLETLGGIPGPRNLDVTIHAVPIPPASTPSSSDGTALLPNPTDTTLALSIPAVRPVHAAFDTHLLKRRRAVKPLLDLEEPTGWEGASDAIVVAALTAAGPWEVEVARVQLRVEVSCTFRRLPALRGDKLNAVAARRTRGLCALSRRRSATSQATSLPSRRQCVRHASPLSQGLGADLDALPSSLATGRSLQRSLLARSPA